VDESARKRRRRRRKVLVYSVFTPCAEI